MEDSATEELEITLSYSDNFDDCAKLRIEVFMNEQGFSYDIEDVDKLPVVRHIAAYDNTGECVGCLRYFPVEEDGTPSEADHDGTWTIGRITVAKSMRGKGLGSMLLGVGEAEVALAGGNHVELHAQYNKLPFYHKNGYVEHGEIDYDEFMEHIWMGKDL